MYLECQKEKKEKETEEMFGTIMAENISEIHVKHLTIYPGSSENTKRGICQDN